MDKRKLSYLNQHGKPTTRREFIARGLAAGGGIALLPATTGFGILSAASRARAQEGPLETNQAPAFLIFDLAGGAGLPGNFLVGKSGGPEDLLTTYQNLGWNPRDSAAVDRRYGLPMAAKASQIFAGIGQKLSPEAQARFRMGSALHVSQDDTPRNPLSLLGLASEVTNGGRVFSRPLGLTSNPSGGSSVSARDIPEHRAYSISRLSDLTEFGSLPRPLEFARRDPSSIRALGAMLESLAPIQLRALFGGKDSELEREYRKVLSKLQFRELLDPRLHPVFKSVYELEAAPSESRLIRAGLVMSALLGTSGAAAITIGGCDYHDGTTTTGDAVDLSIGIEIGNAVEAAHRLGRALFIQVLTDGGVSSQTGTRNWIADDGQKSMSVFGFYDPSRTPRLLRTQLGSYTDGQGADRSTLIGDSPQLAAFAVFANYLNVCGRLGEFDSRVGRGVFTKSQLESLLIFEG